MRVPCTTRYPCPVLTKRPLTQLDKQKHGWTATLGKLTCGRNRCKFDHQGWHKCSGRWTCGVGTCRCPDHKGSSYCRKTDITVRLCSLILFRSLRLSLCNAVMHVSELLLLYWLTFPFPLQEHPDTFVLVSCSPGRIDPDDVQMAEVVALGVQRGAASAASGPRSEWRGAVSGLHLLLLHQRKT